MAQETNIEIKVAAGAALALLKKLEEQLKKAGEAADDTSESFDGVGNNGKKTFAQLAAGVSKAIPVIGKLAGAVGAVGAGLVVMADKATKSIIEMRNLSTVAGVSFERFQALQYATSSYGVTAEQLSDQLKDVNDKVGDFVATGGGEFADVFEGVLQPLGYTIEQLKEMSSDQILGAVIDGTEKLGLSQKEQVFYMEAIANDASKLIPLYRDNAKELRNMTQAANEMGVIIPEDQVAAAEEFQKQMKSVSAQVKIAGQQMGLIFLPAIDMVAQAAQELFKWLDEAFGITNQGKVRQLTEEISDTEKELAEVSDKIAKNSDIVAGYGYGTLIATKQRLESELKTMRAEKAELEKETRKTFEASTYTGTTFTGTVPDNYQAPVQSEEGRKKSRGKTQSQIAEETLEELRRSALDEASLRQENFNNELAQLKEFHERKLITEEEYYQAQDNLFEKYTKDIRTKKQDNNEQMLTLDQDLIDQLGMSAQNATAALSAVAGEQNALYSIMFGAQKGFAIASAAMNIEKAISDGWAQGSTIYEKVAAVAAITANTASIVGNIQAITYQADGARQTGGSTLSGGNYRVNERTPEMYTNQFGEDFLTIPSGSGGKITRLDNQATSMQGAGINLKIENYGTSKDFEVQQYSETDIRIIARDEANKQIAYQASPKNRNSAMQNGMRSSYKMQPKL